MVTTNAQQVDSKKRRAEAFALFAGFLSFVLLIAGTFEFIPAWILRDPADDVHLWHIAELAALAVLLLGGVIFGLLKRPQEKPLLAQFFVLSMLLSAVAIIPFNLAGIVCLVIAGLFIALYPDRRALFSFPRGGRLSLPLLALTVIYAVCQDPRIQEEVNLQIVGGTADVHALQLHWIGSALLIALLIVAGFMAATKRPGWERLGIVTGTTYIYLGAIALIVPTYAGSWGEAGGLFAAFGGVLYILITLAEMENMRKNEQARAAQAAMEDEDEFESDTETARDAETVSTSQAMLAGTK
ncbi:MAG TPA: hypothetical protein VJ761_02490 [Ktedonobacteraceae bacterium]|nr:hypothetical protein [Ktedonobacteraceae bacterium]